MLARECQATGIPAFDAQFKEEVLVVPDVLALLGDSPMHSELACHMGLAARLFCRICRVSSQKFFQEDGPEIPATAMDVDDPGGGGNISDGASSTGDSPAARPTNKSKVETVNSMLVRLPRGSR